MGPIGWPETVFIFFLALILFGPKKLPELGRTVGKALAGFQRAKRELTDVLDHEAKKLELDTEMLTSFANEYRGASYQPLDGTITKRAMSAAETLESSSQATRLSPPPVGF